VAGNVRGARALAVQADVSNASDVARLVDETQAAFGRVNGLVNTTGAGCLHCSEAFMPGLLASRDSGTIVNVASVAGAVTADGSSHDSSDGMIWAEPPAYSGTQLGIVGLTRHLAAYYGARGLRVNALVPDSVLAGPDAGLGKRYAWRPRAGRLELQNDYSGALQFLLSDASSYMTAACLVVGGAWVTG